MEKKVDRRIRRTQKVITDNFIELLLEKSIKDIRVQTLTDRADINRGTFYQHYEDIYDLLNSIEDEIVNEFTSALDEAVSMNESGYVITRDTVEKVLLMLLDKILLYVKENEKLIIALFREDQDTKIKQKLRRYLYEYVAKNYVNRSRSHKIAKEFSYFHGYVTSGCVEVIAAWIRGGLVDEPEHVARMLEQFILQGAEMFLSNAK